ncbi:hypothetical protein KR093_006629 [Drosophila rubida]|uniref:Beta-1,4-glucuronyltransferase 1 n=1 Tax=Drosophila rubida TaxID=30044 RepID=A0AAD4PP35_9MUSC|nr:hypothetical protein KR093_006629 [Drosophila rubida]
MAKHSFQSLVLVLNVIAFYRVVAQWTHESESIFKLRLYMNCTNVVYESKNIVHSSYWVMLNYVPAAHGNLKCYESVTYTTHADYRYLSNVGPLVKHWRSPISLALYAPGLDFESTVKSILWLRQCDPQSKLIVQWVSFHIYFDITEIPRNIPKTRALLKRKVWCRKPVQRRFYRLEKGLSYPVNVGRNIARNASLTHYVLASDIELYPSSGLARGFLQMLMSNLSMLNSETPNVYPLKIFEVQRSIAVPNTKTELQHLLAKGYAQPFHMAFCSSCHNGPRLPEWINTTDASNSIKVFHITKWMVKFRYWEPIYIGTKNDPLYDERLNWEGMWDKKSQTLILCLLDYAFNTLDNAFLVHKPGIKLGTSRERLHKAHRTYRLLKRDIIDIAIKYSWRFNCAI